jgi:hypothetical protein
MTFRLSVNRYDAKFRIIQPNPKNTEKFSFPMCSVKTQLTKFPYNFEVSTHFAFKNQQETR